MCGLMAEWLSCYLWWNRWGRDRSYADFQFVLDFLTILENNGNLRTQNDYAYFLVIKKNVAIPINQFAF